MALAVEWHRGDLFSPGTGTRGGSWTRRAGSALSGVLTVGISALALSACGGSSAGALTLSSSSGAPGALVTVSGNAGSGCVVDKTWLGFKFARKGQISTGPLVQMTTPVTPQGVWSASFTVPSYLGGPAKGGHGGAVGPGTYQFASPDCKGGKVVKATFRVTSAHPSTSPKAYVAIAVTTDGRGYWLLQSNGHVSAYGDAHSYGSLPPAAAAGATAGPAPVGIARTYDNHGYWVVGANGHVYNLGDAHKYGSLSVGTAATGPVTAIAPVPSGKGYWLLAADGHVYGFGDAHVEGMPPDHVAPFDAIGARPGGGYVVTASDNGAVYIYPGGSLSANGPGSALSADLVSTAVSPSGNGTWQAGTDGGVITSGDAGFFGAEAGSTTPLKAPVTAIAATPDGKGYWLVGSDGTIYSFGDATTFTSS